MAGYEYFVPYNYVVLSSNSSSEEDTEVGSKNLT